MGRTGVMQGAVSMSEPPEAVAAAPELGHDDRARLDSCVQSAQAAAAAFRELGQEQVDRIVWAMVVAGLEHAVELAELATQETGFGVFEDKVVKNYVATEFLYDYLKDKKSVGVIDEDPERAIEYVAEPIGVVLALLPITNPTSTVLFKAIVGAKTRNAMVFRPSARATRCATRAVELLQEAGESAGLPRDALQVIPDPTLDVSQYLFHHPGVDFIWTTGGPKAVAATLRAGKPCIGVGPGNAPVYVHHSADLRMAVVDMLVSKTFDSSVICPAEQTCVVDDAVHDELIAEFQRMGARVLGPQEVGRLAAASFADDGSVEMQVLGQSCVNLGAIAGFEVDERDKILIAPLPGDLDELAAHPFLREKLMPVLGIVRSPSVEHALRACEMVTENGGLGHTSAVYARDDEIVRRFSLAVRTGRILVNAPTAVGALGGVYNSMTPTFSLGCGTWGGSTTTDNVNYRNLLNIKTVSRRQSPPQWFRVPSDTYFNPGALDSLRELRSSQVLIVTDADTEARGVVDDVRTHLPKDAGVHVFTDVSPEPAEDQVRAGVAILAETRSTAIVALGGGSVIDAAKAMRLFHESPELSLRELSLPFLDARKRVAKYPQVDHSVQLVAVPTTAGTGSEVSPAAVLTVDRTQGHAGRLLAGARCGRRRPAPDADDAAGPHGGHGRGRADARARGRRLDLRLALHRRVLHAGDQPDPRGAAARLPRRVRPRRANRHVERRDDRRPRLLERVRRRLPLAGARGRGALRHRTRPRQRDLPAARAALQRCAPVEVHAGPGLHPLRRAREVRADGLGARCRRARREQPPRSLLRAHRRSPRRGRHAALAGRCGRLA